ncbi:MAG: 50S ribosomal protein L31 [Leptonema illini]|jgi:large subunit ribosomal protein L31|uniref:Large ribosomal subunit protein bL31 n=2 Tax=Leptonema illini TaxID=183 RepID=H2CDY3_9LEPT|nr:50S ribosomal protein L31 [Leptonema illini]EHQ05502.1 LSU ribosomal protein L31P [Leptonema illini DSM 21528]KAB2932016.1 MAG: 50S ribosomal protein L31 [Leptonema illini]PKL33231.1 MAG: 50S ribosomal protein L31 [Spirochaetae bacterium HGW-Spirochaetae-10]
MKAALHPEYNEATITCVCGATYKTRTTKGDMTVEICANCHPFFTGTQKIVDAAGRVERFKKKFKMK